MTDLANIERTCARCDGAFVVDTSLPCWWSKKFCGEDCRKAHQNEIRCQKAKSAKSQDFCRVKKCEWCDEPFVVDFEHRGQRFCDATCARDFQRKPQIVLTPEQREANEILRRQRSADSRRGQVVSQELRDKTSTTLKRRYAAGEIEPAVFERTPEYREKISQGMVRAYREGRVDPTGSYQNKWHTYVGPKGTINMRSRSETLFAHHLDSLGVDWQYEPERFDLGWSTYTPDFYMPKLDRWIEVKGQWTDVSLRKFTEFQQTHLASAVMAKDLLNFSGGSSWSLPDQKGVMPW